MEYRIVAINPSAAYGTQATELERLVSEGFEVHGSPFVWREQVLQALVRSTKKQEQPKRG